MYFSVYHTIELNSESLSRFIGVVGITICLIGVISALMQIINPFTTLGCISYMLVGTWMAIQHFQSLREVLAMNIIPSTIKTLLLEKSIEDIIKSSNCLHKITIALLLSTVLKSEHNSILLSFLPQSFKSKKIVEFLPASVRIFLKLQHIQEYNSSKDDYTSIDQPSLRSLCLNYASTYISSQSSKAVGRLMQITQGYTGFPDSNACDVTIPLVSNIATNTKLKELLIRSYFHLSPTIGLRASQDIACFNKYLYLSLVLYFSKKFKQPVENSKWLAMLITKAAQRKLA